MAVRLHGQCTFLHARRFADLQHNFWYFNASATSRNKSIVLSSDRSLIGFPLKNILQIKETCFGRDDRDLPEPRDAI
jgi:hypothetical protein